MPSILRTEGENTGDTTPTPDDIWRSPLNTIPSTGRDGTTRGRGRLTMSIVGRLATPPATAEPVLTGTVAGASVTMSDGTSITESSKLGTLSISDWP